MGARSPHKKEGREASPGKVSKQSRGTIQWMVPRNAFADPRGSIPTPPAKYICGGQQAKSARICGEQTAPHVGISAGIPMIGAGALPLWGKRILLHRSKGDGPRAADLREKAVKRQKRASRQD